MVANGAESQAVSQKDRHLLSPLPPPGAGGAADRRRGPGRPAGLAVCARRLAGGPGRGPGSRGRGGSRRPAGRGDRDGAALGAHGGVGGGDRLLDALEGLEGYPQPKPPRPEEIGLRGRPTLVQNVESLAAVAALFRLGRPASGSTGTRTCPGTALFTVTGAVERPGVYEVPHGTPLAELLTRPGRRARMRSWPCCPAGWARGRSARTSWTCPSPTRTWWPWAPPWAPPPWSSSAGLTRRCPPWCGRTWRCWRQGSCGQCRGCKEGHRELLRALEAGDLAEARRRAEVLLYGRGNSALPSGTARFALGPCRSSLPPTGSSANAPGSTPASTTASRWVPGFPRFHRTEVPAVYGASRQIELSRYVTTSATGPGCKLKVDHQQPGCRR